MKTLTIHITKDQLMKAERARHRAELIEAGVYNIHRGKVIESKKSYTRKDKHKKKF